MAWLQGLYIITAIFGVGVTVVDLLGLLGEGDSDSAGDGADDDASGEGGGPVLFMLRYLRTAVYFALGFGPLGLVAGATGFGTLGSLAWAVPGGLVSAWLARTFFTWQQKDMDSTVRDHELLAERAQVLVPISYTDMGRVRIRIGQSVVERYALAEHEWETFKTDDVVEVTRVTDDCVYVGRSETATAFEESC